MGAPVVAMVVFRILGLLTSAGIDVISLSVMFATLIPTLGILYSARLEGLSLNIDRRSARWRPLLIAIISYAAGFFVLLIVRAPLLMSGLMIGYSINTLTMFLITLRWKISIHAAGVTGPMTFLIYRLGLEWGWLYLLVVPVALVRLRMRAHTIPQLMAGAILTALLTWAQITFLLPLL